MGAEGLEGAARSALTAARGANPSDEGEVPPARGSHVEILERVPVSSRSVGGKRRGFAIYAALRSLGRDGLAAMIERCCAIARRMADGLRGAPGVTILNEIVLNQVLVRFAPPGGDADAAATDDFTRRVIAAVQADGTCWLGGTTWHGMAAMRISVSNWSTTETDADLSVEAILRCAKTVGTTPAPA